MSKALVRALARQDKAENEVERILKTIYPPGTEVRWKRNGIHEGVVVANGYHDRIMVRNERTGRSLWIYAYCIADLL